MSEQAGMEQEYQGVVAHFDAGRYEAMYHAAAAFVQKYPEHGKGWHMHGLAALICGQAEAAEAALQRAAALQPANPEVWDHLGTACNFLQRFAEAREHFARSLALDSTRAETWVNAGKNLRDQGLAEEARQAYARAIALKPQLVEAHNNLGVILLDEGRHGEAAEAFRAAIRVNPDHAWAHNNLGIALKELGQYAEALQSCRRALDLDPHNAKAWNNLGNVQHELGREEDALAAYRQALAKAPDDPESHNNLGSALAALKRPEEAARAFRAALQYRPDYVEAWNNLGNALPDLDGKLAAFRRALALKPDFPLGRSNLLFNLHYLPQTAPAELLTEARAYGQAVAPTAAPPTAWRNPRDPQRPLKIGLVSADFREHPVAYFLDSVLAAVDPRQLDLYAYDNERPEDSWTARFKTLIPHWRNIAGQADATVAAQIAADGIDILVDLAGHTAGHRLPLFARRAAPIQVSWLGYFGTTGVAAMDYLLADPWCVPAGEENQYTEQVRRLPETRLCFTPPPAVPIGPLPSLGSGQLTFGCFNNFNKLNDRVLATWAQLLGRLPKARLFLKNSRADHAPTRNALLQRMARHGIDPNRVRFEGSSPREEYLRAYNQVDICLDPFPYPGGTTTVESLWMGVPVLTLTGSGMLARQGESLLHNAGLPDWVAATEDAYVAQAVRLSSDPWPLMELRKHLRSRLSASPVLDAPRFARHLETALRDMWSEYCRRPA